MRKLICNVLRGTKIMTPKKLEPKSKYAEYDFDGDGTVTDEEISKHN